MYVRLAVANDLPRLTEITTSSLKDDPAFDFMWPQWREYPDDNYKFWRLKLQDWLYDVKTIFVVVVVTPNDLSSISAQDALEAGTVVSYCVWERLGTSKEAKEAWARKDTWCNAICRWTSLEGLVRSSIFPRRDADLKHLEALGEAVNAIGKKYWSDTPEIWNIQLIVTDQKFRRRGAATALVRWGCRKADEERLPCRVEASPMGKLLYLSCGFKELGEWNVHAPSDSASLHMWCMKRNAVD